MIRFSLSCGQGHCFEAWFASNSAFDTLSNRGQVNCPDCGRSDVRKALMAPRVVARDGDADDGFPPKAAPPEPASNSHPLAVLRRKIEAEADDVGRDFAHQARSMHEGATPHRPIYGQAKPHEARALIEDGVPIAPLPFTPKSRMN